MTESRWVRMGLRVATILVLGFLYLPLVILGIYAFNESRSQAWPPTSFSLDWFIDAAANAAVRRALVNSLIAATAATAIALVLGSLAALAVQRFKFFASGVAGAIGCRRLRNGARVEFPLRVEPRGLIEPFAWLVREL